MQEGFVRLCWAERSAAEELGERGSHVLRRGNNASWRRGLIVNLQETLNCVQGQGGGIRSGSDRVIV